MSKKKNPPLKVGDRIVLIYMPGENLDPGTKGKVNGIEKSPSFGGGSDYQYRVEWYDDDNNVISTLSLIPDSDSWLFDPAFKVKSLNEEKITDLDVLIKRGKWLTLFRKDDLRYIMKFLELIRQLGVVNMFESAQFLGQTSQYIKKYFDLYRMRRELDENEEEIIEKIIDMSENVRNLMISASIKDLEQDKKEVTAISATNRMKKLTDELVKRFMIK
jgi:hypothetical protein